MAAFKDYYNVLGVDRDATEKDVRRAYRKLAAKHHPDRNLGDPGAEERFKEVNEAYTVLSDSEKRAVYDRYGADGPPPAGAYGAGPGGFPGGFASGGRVYTNVGPEDAEGFSDFFRSLFGGSGMRGSSFGTSYGDPYGDTFATAGRPATAQRPRVVEATLTVDLAKAFHGGPVTVSVDGRSLEVTLPKGVRDGAKLRLRGQAPGGDDLVMIIRHASDPRWRLDGDVLYGRVDVPDHVAVLGGTVRVPTLDGDVDVTVPAATNAGRRLRLRGRGWPKGGAERGDAVAEVRLVVPATPTEAQRELYERLRDLAT